MKITPFLAEGKDDGFVIFRVELDNCPDAYVWVFEGEDGTANGIDVTSFYRLVSFFNQSPEPMIVASMADEGLIEKAFKRMESCPKGEMGEMLKRFNDEIEKKMRDKDEWKEYCEWEDSALDVVKEAEESDGLVTF